MTRHANLALLLVIAVCLLAAPAIGAESSQPTSRPAPGQSLTFKFPDMPKTFAGGTSQMTIFLPINYDANRRHPLLLFLQGGTGGDAGNPGVARGLCGDKDFVCVSLPLFKDKESNQPNLIRPADGKLAWPLYKTMLAKLEEAVPNIDPNRWVLGGFSNGAHMTAALLDGSDGEASARFCAFFVVEGGGKLEHYERLKGKPFLMAYGSDQSRPRATEIYQTAVAAGASGTLYGMNKVGHAFPASEYPVVRAWLLWVTGQGGAGAEAALRDAAAKAGGRLGNAAAASKPAP